MTKLLHDGFIKGLLIPGIENIFVFLKKGLVCVYLVCNALSACVYFLLHISNTYTLPLPKREQLGLCITFQKQNFAIILVFSKSVPL